MIAQDKNMISNISDFWLKNINYFSKSISENNVAEFFENLSQRVVFNLQKNDNISKSINKNIIFTQVKNLFLDINKKYNDYRDFENKIKYNNFKLTLLNKVQNVFSNELYESFISAPLSNQKIALKDKALIKNLINDITKEKINIYQNNLIYNGNKLKEKELKKDISDLCQNGIASFFNKVINNFKYLYSENDINLISKKVIYKITHNNDVNLFIDKAVRDLKNVVISKKEIIDFAVDNIRNIDVKINDNIINLVKNILKDQGDIKINHDIDKIINKFIYNQSNNWKKKVNFSVIGNNFANNFVSDLLLFTNYVDKNNNLYKSKNINNLIKNYVDYDNHLNNKNIFREIYSLKNIDYLFNKILNNNKNFYFRFPDMERKIYNKKYISNDILDLKNFAKQSAKDLDFSISFVNLNKDLAPKTKELVSSSKIINIINVDDKFKNILNKNANIKMKNAFDGFNYLNLVHSVSGNDFNGKNQLLDNKGLLNNKDGFRNSALFNSSNIENTVDLKNNLNKISNISNKIKNINTRENIDIVHQKFDKKYDQLIKKTIDDKINKDMQDITNQVYRNIEKRLKSEQRRYGIM